MLVIKLKQLIARKRVFYSLQDEYKTDKESKHIVC